MTSFETPDIVESWLRQERAYVVDKFGTHQQATLLNYPFMHETGLGGQTAMYWNRLRQARETGQPIRAAQAAGKLASSSNALWASMRSLDWSSDAPAHDMGLTIVTNHLEADNYRAAKRRIDHDDLFETPIGLGLAYLERAINLHNFEQKWRVSHLLRAAQILEDAGAVMAVQFEQTFDETGNLPRPGQSSGNLELWIPES